MERWLREPRVHAVTAAVGVVLILAAATFLVWPGAGQRTSALIDPDAADGSGDATAALSDQASADPSASASAGPSPTVATTTAPPPPAPSGSKPGPANTGVPAGVGLTVVQGDQTYSTPGQVISGLDIHGAVRVAARNVVIRNTVIRGHANPKCNSSVLYIDNGADATLTIEDSEIAPAFPHPCVDGIWAANTTMTRMNIHGAVDGVKAYDNVVMQDSWIHDLSYFASDPNQGGGPTHNDSVQTYEGNQHITLRHNALDAGREGNAAYQVTQDGGDVATDLRIDGNWLDGGGCTLNFAHKGGPTPMTGIYVTNNRFGRNSYYNCPILLSTQTELSQNSGNVWDDTGLPIPAPQRHD
jgi:hypothetical protein